jgi:L-malate glycosyltransferase
MLPAVHQLTPKLSPGDATSQHALQIRRIVRELGHRSEIFVEHVDEQIAGEVHPYRDYGGKAHPSSPTDVLIYHMAIGSTLADFLSEQTGRIVVDYHNITPERFFHGWNDEIIHGLALGRRQLSALARESVLGMADSGYNQAELRACGYPTTAVVPILLDADHFVHEVDAALLHVRDEVRAAGGTDVLFVGRISPNKRQHEVIKAFALYRRMYEPQARLTLVGGSSSARYLRALHDFAELLGVADAVTFTGVVSDAALSAYYRSADVFVCCSAHEGFCLPLLEAMANDLPVIAVAAAAVPETLGAAGVTLDRCDPALLAAAIDRVVNDRVLRCSLVAAGRTRLGELALGPSSAKLLDALRPVISQ